MEIQCFTFNPFAENTYVLSNSGEAIIVDAGMMNSQECDQLDNYLEQQELKLMKSVLTHAHIDHVLGLKYVEEKYGLIPLSHPEGKAVYESCPQVSKMYGIPYFPGTDPDYSLDISQSLKLGEEELELRFVPGHSPGHVVLVHHKSKQVIAGDTLFQESIGRTDLPGGNHEELLTKIREELFSLDDDYVVHPGHGPSTTIGHEKSFNPFL